MIRFVNSFLILLKWDPSNYNYISVKERIFYTKPAEYTHLINDFYI